MEKNNAPLLEMRNIKKGFFGNQVLTDINFTLKEGEVLGLVGENGAGKSTLMKILFGMDVIRETGGYEGDVLIDGEKVQFNTPFDALKAGIGMVHQEFSLIPGFTATENILLNREPKKKSVISEVFGPRLDTLDYKEMDNRAAKAIEKMGVAIDQKMVISSMPVGHKQFTEIARELSKENLKLLILDEPTAVLTERIMQAVDAQKRSDQWRRENGRYIPNPGTWLNGGYWDNEEVNEGAENQRDPEQPDSSGRDWGKGFKPADDE